MDLVARTHRRALLRFLLASPLWAAARPVEALEFLVAELAQGDDAAFAKPLVQSAAEGLNVFDFEPVAKQNLSDAHWAFLSQGVHDEFTLRANREAFNHVQLRPRRLVDVRELDLSTELLGQKLSSPILLAPCGAQKAFHMEAELATARAAKVKDHLQILSTGSSTRIQDVVKARGEPVWFQLYTPRLMPLTRLQLSEAEEVGSPAVVVTVDTYPGVQSNRDRVRAFRRADNPSCQACHAGVSRAERALRSVSELGNAVGFDVQDALDDLAVLDWEYLDRIRDATDMKLLVKGIQTPEDARLCVQHGVDGIVVSNHGGRAEDSGLSTIEVLPGIAEAVGPDFPIVIDSGFRRGPDLFKGLALGASAVAVGRPYLWGLSAFGQEGVEAVLALLREELEVSMKQMGTPRVADITREHVQLRPPSARG